MYGWLGWEYRKPARVPPACPFKPNDNKVSVEIYSLRLVNESLDASVYVLHYILTQRYAMIR